MKKTLLLLLLSITLINCAEEKKTYSNGKEIFAKSFIDKKAPQIIVEKWLTKEPDLTGKYVLIDFWATWCGPCRELIPELNAFQKEFKNDLVVIGISDEAEQAVKNMTEPNIDYYSAIDPTRSMRNVLKVRMIPHCIIINPDGIVVWEGWPQLEGHELTSEVIRDLINKRDN